MRAGSTFSTTLCVGLLMAFAGESASRLRAQNWRVDQDRIGSMGTGSNMFRSGLVHSSGVVFIGTYGPEPALIWRFDPRTRGLEKIAAPGEYQLDSMVEAPNGMIYIGTAYEGLVYRLDPQTGEIKDLGTPPIDSTKWIFTMIRTRSGEIYGSKGVGLFRLDWRNDTFEPLGTVPGDHGTLGPDPSNPIVRELVEMPSGRIYGDTNRWLFRFDPATKRIEPLVDMVTIDPACYALFLPHGGVSPTEDCFFALYSRFSGAVVKELFYVYRAAERRVEPLPIDGFPGNKVFHPAWYTNEGEHRLLVPTWREQDQRLQISVVDPFSQRMIDVWEPDAAMDDAVLVPGGGLFFRTSSPAGLLQADPRNRRLETVARNPVAAECRCLAISPQGLLGTDTYDCGHAFTLNPKTQESRDHGRVWHDDHRCNYGPAAFAGRDGRYLVANHGQCLHALWVTDTVSNRHGKIGPSAIQLVAMSDGSVWGTTGPNPKGLQFDPERCWLPSWQARGGRLFRYTPGEKEIELWPVVGDAGPIAEAPRDSSDTPADPPNVAHILLVQDEKLRVFDPVPQQFVATLDLEQAVVAMAHSKTRDVAYMLLSDGRLFACRPSGDEYILTGVAADFGQERSVQRGLFVLPESGQIVGVAADGLVTSCDPSTGKVSRTTGPPPLPAGPAVALNQDSWYYADRAVTRFSLRMAD